MALAGVTDQIVYLEEGDVVDLQLGKYWISHADAERHQRASQRAGARPCRRTAARPNSGPYRHYMQKEIFEQPRAIADTLDAVRRHLARAVRRRRAPRVQGDRPGADPGLRHQLLQRLGRQVLARGDRQDPDRGRDRQRIPLPRQRAEPAHAGRHHHPERRDRRHAGGAEARARARHGAHADGLQRRHQRDGARVRAGLHHARRRRDRRRLDQGLHDPAGRPVPADAGAGAGARPPDDAQEART